MKIPWNVERVRADVASLHALGIPNPPSRLLRWCEPTDTQLVIGRAQRDVDGVRRSSGGGAVLVVTNEIVWFDVVVPKDDPLWDDDVMRAFWWLGETVARVLGNGARVYTGKLTDRDLPQSVCYGSLGPGEVTVGDKKILGVSQRRTREAAMFQCSILLKHRTEEIGQILQLTNYETTRLGELVGELPGLDVPRFEAELALALP